MISQNCQAIEGRGRHSCNGNLLCTAVLSQVALFKVHEEQATVNLQTSLGFTEFEVKVTLMEKYYLEYWSKPNKGKYMIGISRRF